MLGRFQEMEEQAMSTPSDTPRSDADEHRVGLWELEKRLTAALKDRDEWKRSDNLHTQALQEIGDVLAGRQNYGYMPSDVLALAKSLSNERDALRKEVGITRQIQHDLSIALKTGNPSATELHYAQYAIADLRERAMRAEDERDQLRADLAKKAQAILDLMRERDKFRRELAQARQTIEDVCCGGEKP